MNARPFAWSVLILIAACGDDPDALLGFGHGAEPGDAVGPDAASAGGAAPDAVPTCTEKPVGKAYVGFGQTKLEAGRVNEALGTNRGRVKPYDVLAKEYARTLGAAPPMLGQVSSTFGQVQDRWYSEPQLNAVSTSTAYHVAFQGCLTYVQSKSELAATPTDATASAECATAMRRAWSRTSTPSEVSACSHLATTGLASEPDPRRRWAYVCASIMSSAGFLTY